MPRQNLFAGICQNCMVYSVGSEEREREIRLIHKTDALGRAPMIWWHPAIWPVGQTLSTHFVYKLFANCFLPKSLDRSQVPVDAQSIFVFFFKWSPLFTGTRSLGRYHTEHFGSIRFGAPIMLMIEFPFSTIERENAFSLDQRWAPVQIKVWSNL